MAACDRGCLLRGAQMVGEVASQTSDVAGDGTATATAKDMKTLLENEPQIFRHGRWLGGGSEST